MNPHAAPARCAATVTRRRAAERSLAAVALRVREGDRGQRGFSLIEVLAASAILLGVMLSIMTMFIYGGQHINSGKMMTKATSIASDVQEQFRKLGIVPTYSLIEDEGTPAEDSHYTWNSDTDLPNYPDATAAYQAILEDWADQVETGLPQGTMTITVRSLQELGDYPLEIAFDDAIYVQVVVTVRWKERRRLRSVVFESVKT